MVVSPPPILPWAILPVLIPTLIVGSHSARVYPEFWRQRVQLHGFHDPDSIVSISNRRVRHGSPATSIKPDRWELLKLVFKTSARSWCTTRPA